ncbi:MAG: UDP-N-acetylmuramoyl-L-alanine--D-glutamate ligase [Solirubrobacterales bacterium]
MDCTDRHVLIAGLARSGVAAAKALARRGARVAVCDAKSAEQLQEAIALLPEGVVLYTGQMPDFSQNHFDLAVISPGVPIDSLIVTALKQHDVPVIGELELAYRLKKASVGIIAITGTNGKTTTTALVEDVLKRSGMATVAAGNIGHPLVAAIEEIDAGIIACEVSSFQLETTDQFHPIASAIINITPDHLDRHKTIEGYAETKMKVFRRQNPGEYTVLNADDPWLAKANPVCGVLRFSTNRPLEDGIWVENGMICAKINDVREEICPRNRVRLRGKHNLENVMCAIGLTRSVGIPAAIIRESLEQFGGVRHRMEEVRVLDDVLYVNDSKGTNPDSTIKALESYEAPVVLIAGGRSKGADFTELMSVVVQQGVKAMVLVGEARSIIRNKAEEAGFPAFHEAETFEEAVALARDLSSPGDVVLLSPACASWDMFKNFEERGDLFCDIVRSFKGR